MLTRTARRYNGSQQVGVTSTASTSSAAAERKSAPTLVGSAMPSSTATRRAPAHRSSTVGSAGRFMAHSTPRVRGKPVSRAKRPSSAVYTGRSPHRAISSRAWPRMWSRWVSRDTGTRPASRARPMTFGLSAMNRPRSAWVLRRSWPSVSRANTSSSGALKSVISMMLGMAEPPQSSFYRDYTPRGAALSNSGAFRWTFCPSGAII